MIYKKVFVWDKAVNLLVKYTNSDFIDYFDFCNLERKFSVTTLPVFREIFCISFRIYSFGHLKSALLDITFRRNISWTALNESLEVWHVASSCWNHDWWLKAPKSYSTSEKKFRIMAIYRSVFTITALPARSSKKYRPIMPPLTKLPIPWVNATVFESSIYG